MKMLYLVSALLVGASDQMIVYLYSHLYPTWKTTRPSLPRPSRDPARPCVLPAPPRSHPLVPRPCSPGFLSSNKQSTTSSVLRSSVSPSC